MVFKSTAQFTTTALTDEAKAAFGSPTSPLWCRQLLADSTLQSVQINWRTPKPNREDTYLSGIMNQPDTISAWHSLYRTLPASAQESTDDKAPMGGELLSLFALGSGVNGHIDVAHGGVTASILDVSLGTMCQLHCTGGDSSYTLELNIRYKKPLVTPGIYLTRVWLQKRSTGRKAWLQAAIEDGNGNVYAECDSFWLEVPRDTKL